MIDRLRAPAENEKPETRGEDVPVLSRQGRAAGNLRKNGGYLSPEVAVQPVEDRTVFRLEVSIAIGAGPA